jgi:hypothetical protein
LDSYDFNETLELARKTAKANVIIAVPRDINMISDEEIRRWKAIKNLIGKYKDSRKQRGLRKEQDRMKDGLKNSIERFAAANNFVFVTSCGEFKPKKRGTIYDESQKTIDEVIDPFIRLYFKQFPDIKGIIKDRTPTNLLIEEVIALKNRKIRKSGKLPEYIREIMEILGLVEIIDEENYLRVIVREPNDKNPKSMNIWNIIDENTESIVDIYSKLKESPIGLPDELIELFLAAYIGNEKAQIWDHHGEVELTKRIMKQITEKPDAYSLVKIRSLDEAEKTYILNLWVEVDKLIGKDNYAKFSSSKSFHEINTWNTLQKDLEYLDKMIGETGEIISSLIQYISFITKKTIRFSEIDILKELKETIVSAIKIKEPIKGCEYLKEIADHLEGREIDGFDSKISVLREIFSLPQNRYIFRNLSVYLKKMNEIPLSKESSYSDITDKLNDLAEFLDQTGNKILTDEKAQENVINRIREVWNAYVYHYSEEHEQASQIKIRLKKSILESTQFLLLDELSRISFSELVRSDKIRTGLFSIVSHETDEFNPAQEMAFPFDLRKIDEPNLPNINCPNCSYNLGEIKTLKEDLRNKQKMFTETMQNAINEHFKEFMKISKDFLWYLNKTHPDKREEFTNCFIELTDLIIEHQEEILGEEEIQKAASLIKTLKDLVNEFLSDQEKPIEKKILTFSIFTSEIRARMGREKVTIDRFEEEITKWIKETKKKLGKEAMIEFGSEK